jgi:peptidoglycan/LPS O-acetylase OafA/YrhL
MSQTLETKTHYRADIQGLRGIAVLLVVVYHTGLALPGGFVGVDMFFVISGFVITQVLIREYEETGRIKLGQFYARRARRLIPALSIVTIFTLLISLVAMSPFGEQQQIIKTAIASTFFAGNIHLFAMNSYEALKDNPLRHLWSLGVEEQFYWVYPVFFLMLLRIARKQFINVLTIVLIAFAIVSFGFGVLLTYGFEFGYTESSVLSTRFAFFEKIGFQPGGGWPAKFAFFGAPARFWEILLGSLTALLANQTIYVKRTFAVSMTSIGIVLIILSSLALSSLSSFPGYLALMPTLGTVLLIAFNQQIKPVNKFLSSSWLVFFGDISYSLYLWHWPLVVFSRAIWPGTSFAPTVAASLSVIPAVLSFNYIEKRFQKPHAEAELRTFRLTAVMMAVPLVLSFGLYKAANTGLGIPVPDSKWLNFATQNNCGDSDVYVGNWDTECVFGDDEPGFTAVLIGDSNARSASDGVLEAVSALRGELLISVFSGCPLIDNSVKPDCRKLNKERFNKLENLKPDLVFLVSNYTVYSGDFSESQIIEGLKQSLDFLSTNHIPTIVQGQIPDCLSSGSIVKVALNKIYECELSPQQQDERSRLLDASRILTLRHEKNVFVDPTEIICPKNDCQSFRSDSWIYSDKNHLSVNGSRMLTTVFIEAINKVLEQE